MYFPSAPTTPIALNGSATMAPVSAKITKSLGSITATAAAKAFGSFSFHHWTRVSENEESILNGPPQSSRRRSSVIAESIVCAIFEQRRSFQVIA